MSGARRAFPVVSGNRLSFFAMTRAGHRQRARVAPPSSCNAHSGSDVARGVAGCVGVGRRGLARTDADHVLERQSELMFRAPGPHLLVDVQAPVAAREAKSLGDIAMRSPRGASAPEPSGAEVPVRGDRQGR